MGNDRTLRKEVAALPVQTLVIEVMEGPDAGKKHQADAESISVGTGSTNDLVLTDRTVSRYHLELLRTPEGIEVADLDSTNGTFSGSVRLRRAVVVPGARLMCGRTTLRVQDGGASTVAVHEEDRLGPIRGGTDAMRRLMAKIVKAAQADVPVLLQGESGTGKELIARALHDEGPRRRGPFVTVDCGALAPNLVASELFGHEKGAFTGADRQHAGAFERANGGTLFLDEIGELPPDLQSNLLGALERRRFRRLGGRDEIEVDLRLVSATHRDLRADVNAGSFRLDLYYRLAVVTLPIPSLRERAGDIPLLVEYFLRDAGHDGPVGDVFTDEDMAGLLTHRWPGNVRELRNFVEATVAMGEAPQLDGTLLGPGAASDAGGGDAMAPLLELTWKEARGALLGEFETRYLARLLERSDGNVSKAARIARMDRSHLTDLLQRHGLK